MSLLTELTQRLQAAMLTALPDLPGEHANCIEITPATQKKFGHYQCNSAMKLAKPLRQAPRAIAEKIVAALATAGNDNLIAHCEIAGPGFINLHLNFAVLSGRVQAMLASARLGVASVPPTQKAVVDFSSPNIAKEMHVGHLRSTIIGDCLARVLAFLGYEVLRLNHIGDWGTQFGMLIAYFKQQPTLQVDQLSLPELMQAYRAAKQQFDADASFKQQAQQEVVRLQSGEACALQLWQTICQCSRTGFEAIYQKLDVALTERGESFYNPMLPDVIAALTQQQLLQVSDGAGCVFLPGFENREGEPLPLMVQKSDGGYNYATTDLAALRHRVQAEQAYWLIYVTDAGQSQHFQMVFACARTAGFYDPAKVRVDHVPFGLVLRADGKKFKTRSGDTVRLIDLINEAIAVAGQQLEGRLPDTTPEAERQQTAEILGVNAIKYADLSNNRTSDYVYSTERMLQFEGNTAAFLLYAYVRIQSIKRKVGTALDLNATLNITEPAEQDLALLLCQFGDALQETARELRPNRLTDYLYRLATTFHAFFHHCRVEGSAQQASRLLLCEATARVLKCGFDCLGLRALEQM